MDPIQRDTMFAGLSDREIVEAFGREIRRRSLIGCVFVFPGAGGQGVFTSSTPPNTISHLSAAEQLSIFSEAAAQALSEHAHKISDDTDTSFDPTKWVN